MQSLLALANLGNHQNVPGNANRPALLPGKSDFSARVDSFHRIDLGKMRVHELFSGFQTIAIFVGVIGASGKHAGRQHFTALGNHVEGGEKNAPNKRGKEFFAARKHGNWHYPDV